MSRTLNGRTRRKTLRRTSIMAVSAMIASMVGLATASSASAVDVSGPSDTTPPSLVSFSLASASIDVTAGSAQTQMSAHLTDDLSGVTNAYVNFVSPNHSNQGAYVLLSSGSSLDGTFTGMLALPQYVDSGTWTISSICVHDAALNTGCYSTQQLLALGADTSINVVSNPDTTSPVLHSLSYTPSVVDVTNGSAQMNLTAHLTDDVSGAYYASVTFTSSTNFNQGVNLNLSSGTGLDGTFTGTLTWPQYSDLGTWTITRACVYDNAYNGQCYTTSQLQALGVATAITVSSNPDTTAPILHSLTYSPSSVDVTNGSADMHFTAHLTDDMSGAYYANVTLTGPGNMTQGVNLNLSSGTSLDGTFTGTLTWPQYSSPGEWDITSVCVHDNATNSRCYDQSQLQSMFGLNVVDVTEVDTHGPVVQSLSFTPTSINTLYSQATVNITAHITDDLSGADLMNMQFVSPTGQHTVYANPSLSTGTPNDGTWTGQAYFPQYSEAGTWTLQQVCLRDVVRNYPCYSTADLQALGVQTQLSVVSQVDTQGPVVQSLSFSPTSIDTTNVQVPVNITAHITDDLSGADLMNMQFRSPTGQHTVYAYPSLSTGTSTDGTWTGQAYFPRFSEPGTWTLQQVCVRDVVRNYPCYGSADLQAAGINTSLSVTSVVDTHGPVVQSLSFTPTTINTTNAQATIDITAHVTDDLSGADLMNMLFRSPSGQHQVFAYPSLSAGTPNDGTWTGQGYFPRFSEPGTWTLLQVCVRDVVRNYPCYGASDLQAAGISTTLNISAPDSTPPTVIGHQTPAANSAGWNNSPVTVTWTATDDSGSATTPSPSVVSTEGANQSVTSGTSCDPSSNCATGTYSGINIDTTAPTTTVSGATDGSTYANNAAPTPSCSDSDRLSGVATHATVSVTHTGTAYTATCSGAVDNAGNAAGPVSVHYTVNNPAGYTTVNVANSSGTGLSGVPVTFRPASGTSTSVSSGTDGSASTVLNPGTYTVTATYANGSTSKQLTVTANGPNVVNFATLAVTVNVVDLVAADIAAATVAQAGNSGTFGTPVAVNSSGVATFEVLPGTSSFTARVAGGYQTQSLNVTAGGSNSVTFTTTSVTVNIADPVAADIAAATVAHAGNSGAFGPATAVDLSGNVTFQALPGTSSFTARVAGGYQTKSMTVVAGNANTIAFATVGVTITVTDGLGNLLTNATVAHAGNTGTFGARMAVNSTTAQVTFQALPGTSTFTAWNAAGTKYKSLALTVTGSTSATIAVS